MGIFLKNRLSFNYKSAFLLCGPSFPFGSRCGLVGMCEPRKSLQSCWEFGAWSSVGLGAGNTGGFCLDSGQSRKVPGGVFVSHVSPCVLALLQLG